MYQNYNSNNYFQNQRPFIGLKGHPVSSVDEVRAAAIDFDGSVFYFPDLGNNKIYTKQINMDGTAALSVYELKIAPPELTTDYITRNEFNEAIAKIQQIVSTKEQPQQQTITTMDF